MGVYSVLVGFVTQLCSPSNVCVYVWSVDTCAYIKLSFRLHHTRHSSSVFNELWYGCSVMKLTFYLHQTPWLVGTTVQIMPGLHRVMDTRQVRKYPVSQDEMS